jgi:hypothetical protein
MKNYLALAVVFAAVIVSGCTQDPGTAQQEGNFELLISDQPTAIDNFDYVNTTFSEVRVYTTNASDNTTNQSESFETIQLEDSPTVDLTQVKGDRAISIIEENLEAGNYTGVHLQVSNVSASIDNETADVKIPSERLKINKEFEIAPNSTTSFVFDINVVRRGQSGSYNLLPVISESGVAGQDVEVEEVEPNQPDNVGQQPETPGQAQ